VEGSQVKREAFAIEIGVGSCCAVVEVDGQTDCG
jgi:hypothetical protein